MRPIRAISLAAVAATVLILAGCDMQVAPLSTITGSGHLREEMREVGDLHGVELRGRGTVVVAQGSTDRLRLVAEDNLLPLIEIPVEGHVVRIGFRDGSRRIEPTQPITYFVSLRTPTEATLSGLGRITASHLRADALALTLSGSGSITVQDLAAQSLAVHLSGSGTVVLASHVDRQQVDISGSGAYRAQDLASRDAAATVPGSGTAVLRVSSHLRAEISGAGSIRYVGDPQVEQNVTGSGQVTRVP